MIKKATSDLHSGYNSRRSRWVIGFSILSVTTLVLCVSLLLFGNSKYPIDIVLKVLFGEDVQGATFAIRTLRLPRMLAGLLAGIAFGMAGSTFQTILRNPLASPDIIGITAGSSVGAMVCILVFKTSGAIVSITSVFSGLLVSMLIYVLSRRGMFSSGRLILIGIGIQAMLNAAISLLLLKASQHDIPAAFRWLSGSLNGIQMANITKLSAVVLLFGSVIIFFGRHLKILELGEQSAIALGIRTDIVRLFLVVSSVFLIAFATAITGPISFVAFLSGPIAAKLVGKSEAIEFPAGLVGAILVLGSDLIGQFAFNTRFPVGVITGILGSPYLLILLIRMNKAGGSV